MSKSSIEPGVSALAYQLYVELDWVKPKVWRRFLVPITIELPQLHVILLWGTGWDGGHIHEFLFGHDNYVALEPKDGGHIHEFLFGHDNYVALEPKDGGHIHEFLFGHDNYVALEPNMDLPDDAQDEEGITLREALGARKTFVYIYDYGDNWRHKVKVEKVVSLDAPIEHAICIGGENACPPEEIGGAPGYEEFLEALADPAHPEHAEQKAWIGRDFDPKEFSVDEVNRRLTPEVY